MDDEEGVLKGRMLIENGKREQGENQLASGFEKVSAGWTQSSRRIRNIEKLGLSECTQNTRKSEMNRSYCCCCSNNSNFPGLTE